MSLAARLKHVLNDGLEFRNRFVVASRPVIKTAREHNFIEKLEELS